MLHWSVTLHSWKMSSAAVNQAAGHVGQKLGSTMFRAGAAGEEATGAGSGRQWLGSSRGKHPLRGRRKKVELLLQVSPGITVNR